MKKELKGLSIIFFILILLSAMVGISEADIQGTIGTRFTITDSGFGTKKPQVYVQYESKPGVVKKVYATVQKWSDTSITCLWTQALSAGTYDLWVKPNMAKASPLAEGTFTIMPPEIDDINPQTLVVGAKITVDGQFFTNKKPTVYLKDLSTQKKKSCRVLSSSMDPLTGASSLRFVVPKLGSGPYEIDLQTLVGATSFSLVSISGRVSDSSSGSGIPGVTVALNNSGIISAVTGDDGTYSFINVQNGSYTIAPSMSGYTFSPKNIAVTVNNADVTGQDFVGTVIGPLDNWHLRLSGIPGLRSVYLAFGNNIFVSITDGFSFASADTIDWAIGNIGTALRTNYINSFAYENGLFLAVGTNGAIVTSPDGLTWTPRISGTSVSLKGITYGNGIYVAVSSDNTGTPLFPSYLILTSPDGVNWTVNEVNYSLNAVSYGNGIFVAVGENGVILNSSDARLWTLQNSGTAESLRKVMFGNGIFVAIGYGIFASSDGTTWVSESSNDIRDIAYGNGLFLAASANPYGLGTDILSSVNGLDWNKTVSLSYDFRELCFGNGQFISIGSSYVGGRALTGTSSDGVNWATRDLGSTYFSYHYIPSEIGTYGDGLYVVKGDIVASGTTLLTSPDEINWTIRTSTGLPDNVNISSIAFGNGIFVATSYDNRILTSADGISWTTKYTGDSNPNLSLLFVNFENNMFIAGGSYGIILTSSDGNTWTVRNSDSRYSVTGVAFGNGLFVAVGSSLALLTSQDGMIWTLKNNTVDLSRGIVYGNGIFISGNFLSSDGINWTAIYPSPPGLNTLTFANGYFVGADQNSVYYSTDGITWTSHQLYDCRGVCRGTVFFVNGTFNVSFNGVLFQSDPL